MKVLIAVEDDADMRLLIRLQLRSAADLELISEVATADAAVEAAREHQPELVILDHFIEGQVMGLQAAPMIKEAAPGAKILLFTDHELSVEAAREPAIHTYLPKQRLSELLDVVQAMLAS